MRAARGPSGKQEDALMNTDSRRGQSEQRQQLRRTLSCWTFEKGASASSLQIGPVRVQRIDDVRVCVHTPGGVWFSVGDVLVVG